MKLNNEYDPFASIYNKYWGADYRSAAFPVLRHLLLARLRPGAEVLDVCCGTGQLTAEVAREGFRVAGIDASGAMLGFARENAPGADLHLADARRFALGKRFDAAYSVFESLNHMPDSADLTKAFRSIRRHLKPGSPFLFDLNDENAFDLYWNTVDALVEDDATCVLRMDYDNGSRRGTCRFTAYELKEEHWRRSDFTILQTCHPDSEVQRALQLAGFIGLTSYAAKDVGMKGHTGLGRTFYLAISKAR